MSALPLSASVLIHCRLVGCWFYACMQHMISKMLGWITQLSSLILCISQTGRETHLQSMGAITRMGCVWLSCLRWLPVLLFLYLMLSFFKNCSFYYFKLSYFFIGSCTPFLYVNNKCWLLAFSALFSAGNGRWKWGWPYHSIVSLLNRYALPVLLTKQPCVTEQFWQITTTALLYLAP